MDSNDKSLIIPKKKKTISISKALAALNCFKTKNQKIKLDIRNLEISNPMNEFYENIEDEDKFSISNSKDNLAFASLLAELSENSSNDNPCKNN